MLFNVSRYYVPSKRTKYATVEANTKKDRVVGGWWGGGASILINFEPLQTNKFLHFVNSDMSDVIDFTRSLDDIL